MSPRLLSTNASDKPLYAALGLPEDATPEQIHAAFLNISRAHHPDVQGDPDIFQKARRAHEILMDPIKRKIYDETGLDADNDERMVRALGLIRNIVAGILNDGNVDIDIPARLKEQLDAEVNGVQVLIRSTEAKASDITKIAKNIEKRWRGSPQVKSAVLAMLDGNLKRVEAERLPLNETLEAVRLAVKLMNGAHYESDAEVYWHGQYPVVEVKFGQYPWNR
jgi:curved DNA-binding protein CbpA